MRPYVPMRIRQLRRLLDGMPIGMLTTHASNGATHSRPMLLHDIDDSGWLWFLTDRESRKVWELGRNPQATIAFQSSKGDRYVSVQGTAVIVRDNMKLKDLWNPSMRAWFPRGRRDAAIVLVAVQVQDAEYWVTPRRRIRRVVGAAVAFAIGRRYEAGTHGVLDLRPPLEERLEAVSQDL